MSEVLSLNNILVICGLAAAVTNDLMSRRVDNRLVSALFLLGMITQIASGGLSGLWTLGSSVLFAFVLGLPLYLLKIFGGGDFKLFVAISTLIQWKFLLTVLIASFVWGACLGLIQVAIQGQLSSVTSNVRGLLLRVRPQTKDLHSIPFTVALFFGFLSHLSMTQLGWELL